MLKKIMNIRSMDLTEEESILRDDKKIRLVKSQKGFTLIEIVVTLILVGILAAVGGMGIVQAAKGYLTVKENAVTTQKAQLAMARITREITEMNDISGTATSTVLGIKNISQLDASNNPVGNRTIGFDSAANAVKIAFGSTALASGDVLIDNVSNLSFTYYSGSAAWSSGSSIKLLSAIDVSMTLINPNMTFTTRVSPRNTGNLGGASIPTVTPPIGPRYGCFVATAAYGDSGHPMVQILREFRDKHLIHWPGGQWVVKQYSKHGPAAAAFIHNKPIAMWAVRCLLAPVAALGFCVMYAPLAMIFILLVSLIITGTFFSVWRRKSNVLSVLFNARGSILIGLIITMVIMAILGAAMVPLLSASYMNQFYADQGRRAYYLAESGFSYASSEFVNEENANKNAKLAEINGKTCNLLNDAGSFTTIVYPLWTVSGTLSGTDLPTTVYGTIPDELKTAATGGYIKVGSNYSSYTSRTNPSGNTVTFRGLSPVTGLTAGQEVMSVVLPLNTVTVTNGGNLVLNHTGVNTFPRLNGNFTVNGTGKIYNYAQRDGNVLKNITLSDPTGTWTNFTVTSGAITSAATSKIVLEKFVRIRSTGTIGGASRTVTYNAPVGIVSAGGKWNKQKDDDLPNDINNWTPLPGSFGGTHDILTPPDGGAALKVTNATDVGPQKWAVSVFKGYTNTNLAKAWFDSGGFLSYDVQAKVYNTQPYYFAGLGFRTRNNSDATDLYTYGVSFVRARQYGQCLTCLFIRTFCTWYDTYILDNVDDIDNDLVPNNLFSGSLEEDNIFGCTYYRYSQPAIVLWKRNSSGSKWLAYRTLTAADGILTGTSPNFRLKPWSTLVARIAEGYSLTFTAGNTGTPIKEGDIIRSSGSGNWSARVVMTPILNSACSWTAGSPCSGTLVLANVKGTFTGGTIQVDGAGRATTGTYSTTKKNYIKVYYASTNSVGTANNIETDNNRLANPRGGISNEVAWPPDDVTEVNSSNDYMTLVTWTNTQSDGATSFLPGTGSSARVVVDWDLTTPNVTSSSTVFDFSGDAPAVVTSSDNATSTYYDDFAIQMDMSSGYGFLPPIQE